MQDFSLALYKFKKPIVAAINGHSPAGGCATSMLCDYRVMMDGAWNIRVLVIFGFWYLVLWSVLVF